jgi:hypothetical protein
MTNKRLPTELAVRAMRWRLAPYRFLKPERVWVSRSGFRPLVDVSRMIVGLCGHHIGHRDSGGRQLSAPAAPSTQQRLTVG